MSYEQSTPISSQIKRLGSHLPGLEESFNERGTQPKMPISTLPEFNAVIWGIHSKALTIVGARTSQGKSSLALQLAYDLANQGIPTLFLSLEMTTEALIERMFCNVMKVNNRDLLRGRFKVDDEIQAKWGTFKALVSKIPLLITCGVGKNFREVNELIKLLNPKPKAIFVDYIQNIALNPKESREMINEYIRQFRQMALENDFAAILCSQINRGAEQHKDNEPHLWNLKETGFLEESADICLLAFWENFYTHDKEVYNKYKITIAKNRNGVTGEHYVNYMPEYYRFEEMDKVVDNPPEELKVLADTFNGTVQEGFL